MTNLREKFIELFKTHTKEGKTARIQIDDIAEMQIPDSFIVLINYKTKEDEGFDGVVLNLNAVAAEKGKTLHITLPKADAYTIAKKANDWIFKNGFNSLNISTV